MSELAACHIKDKIPSLGSLKLDRQSSEVTSLSMSVTMEIRPETMSEGSQEKCLKTEFDIHVEIEKEKPEKVILVKINIIKNIINTMTRRSKFNHF